MQGKNVFIVLKKFVILVIIVKHDIFARVENLSFEKPKLIFQVMRNHNGKNKIKIKLKIEIPHHQKLLLKHQKNA